MSSFMRSFTVFPKELFRLNNGNITRLGDRSLGFGGSFDVTTEAGKVYPKGLNLATYRGPNGASMRENSTDQKQLVRTWRGNNAIVYAIPEGTRLPDDLILLQENPEHYSLQPAREMRLEELNTIITRFLNGSGRIYTKEAWLDEYLH